MEERNTEHPRQQQDDLRIKIEVGWLKTWKDQKTHKVFGYQVSPAIWNSPQELSATLEEFMLKIKAAIRELQTT